MTQIENIKRQYATKRAVAMVLAKYGFVSAIRLVYDMISVECKTDLLKTSKNIVVEMFKETEDECYYSIENPTKVYQERARKFIEMHDSLVNLKYEKI